MENAVSCLILVRQNLVQGWHAFNEKMTVNVVFTNGKTKYFSIIVLFYFSFVRLLRLVDGRLPAH